MAELEATPFDSLDHAGQARFLRNNTILSARFDDTDVAMQNLARFEAKDSGNRLLEHMQQDVLHQSKIARGWLALRAGNEQDAIRYLLQSTQTQGSPVLKSFGPDMTLVRALYKKGHKDAVLEYLSLASQFWNTENAQEYIAVWRKLLANDCPAQFQFYDTIRVLELGLE